MTRSSGSDGPAGRTALTALALGEPPAAPEKGQEDLRGSYSYARYVAQNDHYVGFYQTWSKTVLFMLGRQWLKWMDGKRRYSPDTDVPAWRQQPVTNVIYAVLRQMDAKLSKQKPTLEVVPPSGDSDDREAAQLGESVLVHLWREVKADTKLRRARGWFLGTGQVFLRVHWDATAGKRSPRVALVEVPHSDPELAMLGETEDLEVAHDANGEPVLDANGFPDAAAVPEMVAEGDIALDIEDPLSVRYNPEATDADDATEMFVAKLWTRAKAAKHFGLKESDLEAGDAGDREMYADLLSSAATGSGWLGGNGVQGSQLGASQDDSIGARVLVVEYYHAECDEYPEGRHWISVGRDKVWPKEGDSEFPSGESPLPHGFWPPLIPVLSTPIPGQPQAMGLLPQIVPLNEQLNTLDGKIKEHEVTMAMGGKWIVDPADKGMVINSDPAQKLTSAGYAQGRPPMQAKLNALPGEIYAERAVLMEKIRLIGSLSEAELGTRPEGVSAGRAFLVLQEVTDSAMQPDLMSWETAYEEMGRRMLALAQKFYHEPRLIKIRGERGQWEVRSFQGSDLRDGMDVRVQSGSTFPWSKSAQWDTKLSILSQFPGLVQTPEGGIDHERFAQFLDTGGSGLASFESDENPDLVETQREHTMFEALTDDPESTAEVPQIGFWQNHPAHLEAHHRFMKRDYGRFARWSERAKAEFLNHMMLTQQAVEQIAGTMVQANGGAMPGGPGGGAPADEMEMPEEGMEAPGTMTGGTPAMQRASLTPQEAAMGGE